MQELGRTGDDGVDSTTLLPGQTLQGTGFRAPNFRDLADKLGALDSFDHYQGSHSPLPHIRLTTQDVTRYRMAWRAVESFQHKSQLPWWIFYGKKPLSQRRKDWPDLGDVLELPIALGFTIAALIYGGLHALAWFAYFESSTQQLLWRISACVVMGGVPVMLVLFSAVEYLFRHPFSPGLLRSNYLRRLLHVAIYMVVLAYMLARAYLVVECFINLSHLPSGVYDVPSWSTYFPHIS